MDDNYAYPDSEDEHRKRKKGSFQHKLFKVIILIIVAVFFLLIFSFLKIEFFRSKNVDYKFDLNSDKYNYLEKLDKYFYYSKDNKKIDECDVEKFYGEHVSDIDLKVNYNIILYILYTKVILIIF
jgi:hypothetical protein